MTSEIRPRATGSSWQHPPSDINAGAAEASLTEASVDVWIVRTREAGSAELRAACTDLMTDAEAARSEQFIFDRHRLEYLVTRALVRVVLSRYRPVSPRAWRFARSAHGKPATIPSCGLEFNLANHPSMVVCAVSEGVPVGVDVEPVARGTDILKLATTVFSERERRDLARLPRDAAALRAVALWTLKEAYVKALGEGLSHPLQAFSFVFDDDASPRFIDERAGACADGTAFSFMSLLVDDHRVAVAARSSGLEVTLRNVAAVELVLREQLLSKSDGDGSA